MLAGAHKLADALMPVLFCGKKAILCDVLVNRVSGIFRAMIHFANLISSGISLTFFSPRRSYFQTSYLSDSLLFLGYTPNSRRTIFKS